MSAEQSDGVTTVLDTNVLLSLYVFADSRFAPLRDQIETQRWQAVTNEACLAEFARVLNYPMFDLTVAAQEAAMSKYQRIAQSISPPTQSTSTIPLPRCTDADDQKFLELARDSRAKWLITSDRALLKLARRLTKSGMFGIITPEVALAAMPAAHCDGSHSTTPAIEAQRRADPNTIVGGL